jgi:hypothetical protein
VDGQHQGQVQTRRILLIWQLKQEGDYELTHNSL